MSEGSAAPDPGVILVVDDDAQLLGVLRRYLSRIGNRVDTASSAAEALDRLTGDPYDLILTDLQMPGSSGLDLLAEIQKRAPHTRTILMSGQARTTDAATAIEHGVDRLLIKPFSLDDLRLAVEKSLAERRAQEKTRQEEARFQAMLRQREIESRTWVLRAAHALAAAVEAKDAYTAGHAVRVSSYAAAIAEAVGGIDPERFQLAGELHDVGKIGVPDSVLNKPGRLDPEEIDLIQRHPETGRRILEPLIDDALVIGVVRWHHERWDGRGYPDGLRGEEIPLESRILAVADTLDAMTSSRSYREPLPWEVAVAEIRRCAGTQFDPAVVAAFERVLPRLEQVYRSGRAAD